MPIGQSTIMPFSTEEFSHQILYIVQTIIERDASQTLNPMSSFFSLKCHYFFLILTEHPIIYIEVSAVKLCDITINVRLNTALTLKSYSCDIQDL